jgi:hypothetical protein
MKKKIIIVTPILLVVLAFFGWQLFSSLLSSNDSVGLPKGKVTYTFVYTLPEAKMYYPSTTVVEILGGDEIDSPPSSARSGFAGAILATNASASTIYDWYDTKLVLSGWIEYQSSPVSPQTSVRSYSKGNREIFTVAVDDPAALSSVIGKQLPANKTIFEIRLIISPSK